MKRHLFFLLPLFAAGNLAAAAATPVPVQIDDAKPVASRITAVTVFADRARVTRVASVALPAAITRLAFTQLPGWIDEGSVRLSLAPPEAGQILDVQVKRTYLARPTDVDFQKAEAAVQAIADQIAALDDEKKVLDAQAKQVEAIRVFSLDKLPKDTALREVKPEEYAAAVEFVASSLREIGTARRTLEKQRRELQPELNARQNRLNELRQRAQLEQRTVVVTLKGAGKPAALSLTYLLPGATWEPAHELRAPANAAAITLASYAVVMQTSGEDWTDVEMALSTQSSTATMRIPELETLRVGGRTLPPVVRRGQDTFQTANKNWEQQNTFWGALNNPDAAVQQEFLANRARQIDNVKRVQRVFATVQQRGTTAHFAAIGRPTIRTDGRRVRVPIGRSELAARSRILAAPELSLNAVRTVELSNTSAQPLLPGRVALFVGGAFLGLTETDFVAPGESFALYLGVADQIKLSRTLDKKRSVLKRGGSKTKMQVSFLVRAENLSDQPVALLLTERIPVSEADNVRVSSVKVSPSAKPDAQGLLNWEVALATRETREFRIEYALEYPTALLQQEPAGKPSGSLPASSLELRQQLKSLEMKF